MISGPPQPPQRSRVPLHPLPHSKGSHQHQVLGIWHWTENCNPLKVDAIIPRRLKVPQKKILKEIPVHLLFWPIKFHGFQNGNVPNHQPELSKNMFCVPQTTLENVHGGLNPKSQRFGSDDFPFQLHRYQKLQFFLGSYLFQTIFLGIHVSFRECIGSFRR